jgi:hypothetical protein
MDKIQFIKSIINIHDFYQTKSHKNSDFLLMIDKCFGIKKTTFYDWYNDDDIQNTPIIYENNNKLINIAVETFVVDLCNKNKTIGIKNIKKQINDNFKIKLNSKDINYILFKNDIKHKNIKIINFYEENKKIKKQNKIKNNFIALDKDQLSFIISIKDKSPKEIIQLFNSKYNIFINERQIVDIMNKNKISVKSFFKSSPTIVSFILKTIEESKINTIEQIKDLIKKEFKIDVSIQLIYNILKKNDYVYKKYKLNKNPYSVEDQVKQFNVIVKDHNINNIDNCVSIDEISFVLGSKPEYGWFKKNENNEIKCNNKKIIRDRYSLLVASTNKKIILYKICKKGVKTDLFVEFMSELKALDTDNKKYYLMDNARVHKSKTFNKYLEENIMKIVYNAPYHSETNPIENIFSMLRNNLNRNYNETEEELKKSIEDFIKIDNQEKFKNIFNHSCKTMNEFIKENTKV